MNIFTPDAFIGDAQIEGLRGTFETILKQSKQIRIRLGEQGYLLDRYLEHMFKGANAIRAADAAEEGHEAANQLISMCRKFIDGRDVPASTPAYAAVREYIAANPLTYKDSSAVLSEYFVRLTHDYLGAFCKQYTDNLNTVYRHTECKSCYDKIAQIIGGEAELQALNDSFMRYFGRIKTMELLVSGFQYELLNALLYRDNESERMVFQYILDSIRE